jgi:hypothetical protein
MDLADPAEQRIYLMPQELYLLLLGMLEVFEILFEMLIEPTFTEMCENAISDQRYPAARRKKSGDPLGNRRDDIIHWLYPVSKRLIER